MNDLEIFKLIFNGTAAGAVIFVVIIFLKYQKEYNQTLKDITADFTKKVDQSQKDFQIQIDRLSTNYLQNERSYQTQIQKLFDDFILITKETVSAVKELESAVREMKNELVKRQDVK